MDATPLPDDIAACHALLVEQARTITQLHQRVQEQDLTINELMQRAFRHRSERYLEDPNQMKLDFGDTPEAADAAAGLGAAVQEAEILVKAYKRRKRLLRKPRNEQLPAHLPRYRVEVPASDEIKHCAQHGERKRIGYDEVETLEFERPKLKVRVTCYPKHVCENEPSCGVAQPPREPGLVEGNRYGTSVAAEIVTGKCGYHLPIYREQDYFAGCGWTVDRSTLLNIFRASAELVHPLAIYLRGEVLASGAIGTDETRVTLLLPPEIPEAKEDDPKSRRIHEVFSEARAEGRKSVSGRMWAYRSLTVPINVFDFTVSRHRDGPDEFLVAGGFVGKLLGDCYSGYQGITLRSDARIVRAACNAHARRKIFDAREHRPLLSTRFLAMYQELYDIEERGKFLSVGEREELRSLEARPVWQRMRELLDGPAASDVLPKEKFAEALGYLRNQWDALMVYLGDGRLPIDNKIASYYASLVE
jgi:transposase